MWNLVKIYSTKEDYLKKLAEINLKLGYPSKKYDTIINGVRRHFVSDKIVTRTWADEEPFLTKDLKCIFPVPKEYEKDFTGLFDIGTIELKPIEEVIIKK